MVLAISGVLGAEGDVFDVAVGDLSCRRIGVVCIIVLRLILDVAQSGDAFLCRLYFSLSFSFSVHQLSCSVSSSLFTCADIKIIGLTIKSPSSR